MNNEFELVFGEVCIGDCYALRRLAFAPEVIFDIGANVGAFTSYARFMFPHAKIISVEPDPRNFENP